ncbi:MAG: hypothetical protein J3R72DRAFT_507269 [Linnemannia gamsii]|nr:MAG: hypothetical protein J3R72DRAFT_507269 [Linnemannia gamsii]
MPMICSLALLFLYGLFSQLNIPFDILMMTKSVLSLVALTTLLGTTLAYECSRAGFDSCMAYFDSTVPARRADAGNTVGYVNGLRMDATNQGVLCVQIMCNGDTTCLAKGADIYNGPSCNAATCGSTGIACWDASRISCREAYAAGAADYCDPCSAAKSVCMAQSSTNRTTALADCDKRPTPTQIANCKKTKNLFYDDVNDQCDNCVATCAATNPAPGSQYTCVIV